MECFHCIYHLKIRSTHWPMFSFHGAPSPTAPLLPRYPSSHDTLFPQQFKQWKAGPVPSSRKHLQESHGDTRKGRSVSKAREQVVSCPEGPMCLSPCGFSTESTVCTSRARVKCPSPQCLARPQGKPPAFSLQLELKPSCSCLPKCPRGESFLSLCSFLLKLLYNGHTAACISQRRSERDTCSPPLGASARCLSLAISPRPTVSSPPLLRGEGVEAGAECRPQAPCTCAPGRLAITALQPLGWG